MQTRTCSRDRFKARDRHNRTDSNCHGDGHSQAEVLAGLAELHRRVAREKSHFLALLYELCSKVEEPIQVMGRPRLSLRDMLFAVTYRTYTMMGARRFSSDMRDALAKGYVSKAPSFNSVFRYLQTELLTPYLKQLIAKSAKPLQSIKEDFAVDASGFLLALMYAGLMLSTVRMKAGMIGSRCTLLAESKPILLRASK